jgi:carboxymethylenebutenolidase
VPASEEVQIPLPDGKSLRAAVFTPDGEGPFPGVLVLHEIFGLNDDMRRIAGRLAGEGYVALAPDLYSHGNRAICLTRVLMETFIAKDRGALADIEAARSHLAGRPDVDANRIAAIGFCQGGGFALAFAARGGLRAAGVNYGRVPKQQGELAKVCPVVGSYGRDDKMLLPDSERLEQYLSALGIPHDVKVYDGVGHSFMSFDNQPGWMARLPTPMKVGYDEASAEDAWGRILAFFSEHV